MLIKVSLAFLLVAVPSTVHARSDAPTAKERQQETDTSAPVEANTRKTSVPVLIRTVLIILPIPSLYKPLPIA